MTGLSAKHQRFVDEYIIDLNATQAAIRSGYSAKTAEVQGCRLLRNDKIVAAVALATEKRAERTRIDADWVLKRLADEIEADVADLYDDDGKVKPIRQWPEIWRKGLITGIETIPEKVGEDEDGKPIVAMGYRIRLASRDRRLELLGKHVYVSAFREKIDHSSSDGSMSPPSLADFYAAAVERDG